MRLSTYSKRLLSVVPVVMMVMSPSHALQEAAATQPEQQETQSANEAPAEEIVSFEKFATAPETSTYRVDYSESIGFMNSYSFISKGRVKVDYNGIRSGGANSLLRALQKLRDVKVTQLSKSDQLAYWLNLRNLLVIFAITVDNSSDIQEERGTFENPGPLWTEKRLDIEGVNLSIDDIERGIILANWNDPNIFYGLYQGFEGGPSLYKPGFNGATVYDVLPKLGKRFVNAKKILAVKGNTLTIPGVYQWYQASLFKGDETKILNHMRRLSQEKQRKKLEPVKTLAMREISYAIDTAAGIKRKQERSGPRQVSAPRPQAPTGGAPTRRSGS